MPAIVGQGKHLTTSVKAGGLVLRTGCAIGAASRLLREMGEYREAHELKGDRLEKLSAAISYFTNNKNRMSYARHVEANIPIGSGVTEAACKTLV